MAGLSGTLSNRLWKVGRPARGRRPAPVLLRLALVGGAVLAGCAAGGGPQPPGAAAAQAMPGARLEKCGIVLGRGPAGAWDAGMVESPVVWFDEARGRYGMVYVGYGHEPAAGRAPGYRTVTRPQIGLAWSDDLLRWEKDPRSPILGPNADPAAPDVGGTTGPFLLYGRGRYYLYYIGVTASGYEQGTKTLNVATSTDLVHWARYEGNPIIAPAGEGWRRDAIWHPNVVEAEGMYYLFFNASGVVRGVEEERIGYATSTDLLHWDVADEHAPVLSGRGLPGAWDASGRAGDPSLYRVGDTWYMAYYSWDGVHAQDGLAWTTAAAFPLGWRPYERNPVLRIGGAGAYDEVHAHKPFIFRRAGRHYHFYTAVDGRDAREIALAAWPPSACAAE